MNTLITYEWILDDMESRLQRSPKLREMLTGEARSQLEWFKCQGCGEWEACAYDIVTDTMACSYDCREKAAIERKNPA